MSHLLRRYSFADWRRCLRRRFDRALLKAGQAFGDAGAYLDALASDYVFYRATRFTWAEIRYARAHDFDLTDPSEVRRMRLAITKKGGAR